MLTDQCPLLAIPYPPAMGKLHIDSMTSELFVPIKMLSRAGVKSRVLWELVRDRQDWCQPIHLYIVWATIWPSTQPPNQFHPTYMVEGFWTLMQSIYLAGCSSHARVLLLRRNEVVWPDLPGSWCSTSFVRDTFHSVSCYRLKQHNWVWPLVKGKGEPYTR